MYQCTSPIYTYEIYISLIKVKNILNGHAGKLKTSPVWRLCQVHAIQICVDSRENPNEICLNNILMFNCEQNKVYSISSKTSLKNTLKNKVYV